MIEIEVGGAILELPDGAQPDAIKRAVEHFRSTPEFDKLVDKRSGAPARVRMLVGGAPIQDRLANIQRFYPDAVPYGDDNFVFTDPGSGRPTLYNPPGLDFGDVPAVAREAAQFVGGTFGAIAGTTGGPLGTAVGAGAGTAAGGALFDASMNLLAGRVDTRGVGAVAVDTAVDFAGGAVGQRLGELAGAGIKRALGGGKQAAKALVDRFRALGIEPPAGAATGSRTIGRVEHALANTPSSAQIMQEQAERVLSQVKAAADDLAQSFGPTRTQQGAGETIREAAARAAERVGFTQERIYGEAFDMIGDGTPVALDAVAALREAMEQEIARAPRSLGNAMGPAIRRLKLLEADSAARAIEFGALRQVRTMIGREMAEPMLAQGASIQQQGLKRIYGALTEDLKAAATAAGPDAAKKLAIADRFTRAWMNTAAKTMEKLHGFDADEKAFRFAMTSARDGGTVLARMRRHFAPEEWDVVAGSVLGRMGRATPGAQDAAGEVFSVSTFLTNWNRLSPEAKQALFGGKRYAGLGPKLDMLTEAMGSLKGMERLTNTSNTAHVLVGYATLSTLGAALGGLATGDTQGAVVGLTGSVVAPRVAAKLITSPRFLDWLTTPVTKPNAISAHIGRLAGIARLEPEIREEIHQYMQALRSVPAMSEATPTIDQGTDPDGH